MSPVANTNQVIGALMLAVFSGVLTYTLFVDLRRELRDETPLGRLLRRWARRNPALVCGLFAVWGALLGHFFWQWSS